MTKKKQFRRFDVGQIAFLPIGEDAELLYHAIRKDDKRFDKGVFGFLDYDAQRGIIGSTPLRTGQINRLMVNSGIRVVVPTDDVYGKIFPLIQGRYYTDFNVVDVRDKTPSSAGRSLWESLIKLASLSLKRDVKFPFRLQGFYVEPSEDKTAQIIPAPNLRIIEDNRINLKTKFNKLDDTGMVVPYNNGRYTQVVTCNFSLTRVYLNKDGHMNSYNDDLVNSNDYGQGVFLTAEGASQKFLEERFKI